MPRIEREPLLVSMPCSHSQTAGKQIVRHLKKLDPTPHLVNATAFCLFWFMKRAVIASSTWPFKLMCDPKRIARSRDILKTLGGAEIQPQGRLSGMYFDATTCLNALMSKGAERGQMTMDDGKVQELLWLPEGKQELQKLIEEIKLPIEKHEGRAYVKLGIPKNVTDPPKTGGTVVYAVGSGHIYEFRRKTIATFLVNYGMNVLVFHYSGSGKSAGSASEKATYNNMEACYQYLKTHKGTTDEKILSYGHCVGGGPAVHLATKYAVNLLADRTFTTMGRLARERVITKLHLPPRLHFLANWLTPVMNKCFHYNNRDKLAHVKGHVAILETTQDEMIPKHFIDELFGRAQASAAKSCQRLTLEASHDPDLFACEPLSQFLSQANLIGY